MKTKDFSIKLVRLLLGQLLEKLGLLFIPTSGHTVQQPVHVAEVVLRDKTLGT